MNHQKSFWLPRFTFAKLGSAHESSMAIGAFAQLLTSSARSFLLQFIISVGIFSCKVPNTCVDQLVCLRALASLIFVSVDGSCESESFASAVKAVYDAVIDATEELSD